MIAKRTEIFVYERPRDLKSLGAQLRFSLILIYNIMIYYFIVCFLMKESDNLSDWESFMKTNKNSKAFKFIGAIFKLRLNIEESKLHSWIIIE